MKVLITGANGQVGHALQSTAPENAQIFAFDRAALDIGDGDAINAAVAQVGPDLIINAAAYTAVDRAESEAVQAWQINGKAPGLLATAATANGVRFIHISTDFVFDGAAGTPYRTDSPTDPLGVYGASKLAGEQAALAANPASLIVRTAWVYGTHGNNFVRTMLRLMAERDAVKVVADQVGTPTYATGLAKALWALHDGGAAGVHHWTDSGAASWYDFAVAIQEDALTIGLLLRAVPVIPIATSDYPTPARRPSYSILDKSSAVALVGAPAPHWRTHLRDMLGEIKAHG